jgi:tetratricopeptide (TPR) repeat protein
MGARWLVVPLLAAALTTSARADVLSDDPDLEVARRHFEKGKEYYQVGDYPAAAAEFEAARRARPHPALDYNIGRCYDRMERYPQALEAYQRFLKGATDAGEIAEVKSRVEALRARLPTVAPAPTPTPAPTPAPAAAPAGGGGGLRIGGVIVGVAGIAVAVGGGVGFGQVAADRAAAIRQAALAGGTFDPNVEADRKLFRTLAAVSWAAGGVLVAAGALVAVIGLVRGGERAVSVAPAVGPQGAGLVVGGRF